MNKIIVLGSGAAPGVPSLSRGWGACNPANYKNKRTRTSVYFEYDGVKLLIDTSPDLRSQLLANNIRDLDGVLYTHTHADHLHGIDDLREINRIKVQSLNIYGTDIVLEHIRERFGYLITQPECQVDVRKQPALVPNEVVNNKPFYIKGLKITPIKMIGHNAVTNGYVFNDGEVVYIADFRAVDKEGLELVTVKPKIMIVPLTLPAGEKFHASLQEVNTYIEKINADRVIINHMASESDYDEINKMTPPNAEPAFDNMIIEF